jgi:transcriptional regulator with XRE-family HTH domain
MKETNSGTFSTFLRENFSEETLDEVELAKRLASVAVQAAEIVTDSPYTQRQLASRMGLKSTSTLQRIVSKADAPNVTLETLWRLARACGFELRVEFVQQGAEDVKLEPLRLPSTAPAQWQSIPSKPEWLADDQEEEEDSSVISPLLNAAA